ncbi:MAG: HugZ family pyridoxamine 5'-phosphate oxidase [bacterium]
MTTPRDTLKTLLADVKALQIATVSAALQPHVSYVPCIVSTEGDFYVLISELAQHTQNLQHNPQVSILIMGDESEAQPIFARTRLNYYGRANRIEQSDPQYPRFLAQMAQQFGEIIHLLKQLPDFHLFRFTPQTGRLVIGFGQAYQLNATSNSEYHSEVSTQLLAWQITLIKSAT